MAAHKEGDRVLNGFGRMVTLVRLGNGMLGFKHRVKCRHNGCRHAKTGYLTESAGGGWFGSKSGMYLCDLRDHSFDCGRH